MIKTKLNYYFPQFGLTEWLHRKIYFYVPQIFMFCFRLYWLHLIVLHFFLNWIFSLTKLSQVKNTNTNLNCVQRWFVECLKLKLPNQLWNERSTFCFRCLNVTWSGWNLIIPEYHTTKYEWIEYLQLFLVCRNGVKLLLSKWKLSSRLLYWHFLFEFNLRYI